MNSQILASNTKLDKAMTTEQFNQIVEAILAGQYSWACVLILRFAGYNPLHYIPYRTYNRLMKDHGACTKRSGTISNLNTQPLQNQSRLTTLKAKMTDLDYLDTAEEQYSKVHGGSQSLWEKDFELSFFGSR